MKKIDEKHKQIKKDISVAYMAIRQAEKHIEKLRKKCKHPITFKGVYQWGGPGHNVDAAICSICGEIIETEFSNMNWVTGTVEV